MTKKQVTTIEELEQTINNLQQFPPKDQKTLHRQIDLIIKINQLKEIHEIKKLLLEGAT